MYFLVWLLAFMFNLLISDRKHPQLRVNPFEVVDCQQYIYFHIDIDRAKARCH